MKEEDDLFRKIGVENAFKVPEGYFENVTSEVMSKLPGKEGKDFRLKEPTRWDRMKPLFYMVAMFVGAALIIRIASADRIATDTIAVKNGNEIELDSDEYINSVLNASMMDDYSLYVYLTDTSVE